MSDDDRAAKSARAKALLNKRRAKKGGAAPAAGVISPTPSSPLSRAYSPAPESEAPAAEDEKNDRDLADIFAKPEPGHPTAEIPWLSSLTRVDSPSIPSTPPVIPPPPTQLPRSVSSQSPVFSPPPVIAQAHSSPAPVPAPTTPPPRRRSQTPVMSPPADDSENLRSVVQNQQQTISLLVSEKASLSASLERLTGIDSKTRDVEAHLEQERDASNALRERVQHLERDNQSATARIQHLSGREKELEDKLREQARELQLTSSATEELRTQSEESQKRIRELEEQIQSDDRVERLESELRNVQDRASELEFQISKLKQTNNSFKSEKDELEAQLRSKTESEAIWASKHSELQGRHMDLQKQLSEINDARQAVVQEKITLESRLADQQKTISALQQAATQASSEFGATIRQLQTAQNELRIANRRVEEAERTQQELQAEGTSLMRSLDEMRPKIVELTDIKLELTEKINSLDNSLRERDGVIAQLESSMHELREQKGIVDEQLREVESLRENDRATAEDNVAELQRGYTEMQNELDGALASVRELEIERSSHRQTAARQLEEIEKLTSSIQSLKEEVASLRGELEERKLAEVEKEEFLERARTDVEVLRAEVASKDAEIEQLRVEASSTASLADQLSPSLNQEMVSSLRQQHALELSASQSQIRALQTTVFELEAKNHSFHRQISSLEDLVAQLRSVSTVNSNNTMPARISPNRPMSPPSRPSSRSRNHSDDLRRASFARKTSNATVSQQSLPSQSIFGQNLSAETRHKRKVSLSMLKARIDSEVAAAATATSHPPSRAISPSLSLKDASKSGILVAHSHGSEEGHDHSPSFKHPQFLDESHIFWCHSCRGELVVL